MDTSGVSTFRSALWALSHTMMNNANRSERLHLTGLPPEIRNKIYRFALLEQEPVALSATTPKQPALLWVSRQIRNEAIAIFYLENTFRIVIKDYNAQAVLPAFLLLKRYATVLMREPSGESFLGISSLGPLERNGVPNWHNLVGWCHAVYSHGFIRLSCIPGCTNAQEIAVSAVFEAAKTMQERPWEESEAVLRSFRRVMVLHNPAWRT